MSEKNPEIEENFKEAAGYKPINLSPDLYIGENWENPENDLETESTDPRITEFMFKVLGSFDKFEKRNGKSYHPLFHGLGEYCIRIAEGQASYDALEVIYKFPYLKECIEVPDIDLNSLNDFTNPDFDLESLNEQQKLQLQKLWIMEMENAKGVRNRHKILRSELIKKIKSVYEKKGTVEMVSIACGSAMAVSEAANYCIKNLGVPKGSIKISLTDNNPSAVKRAIEYAKDLGVQVSSSEVDFIRPIKRRELVEKNKNKADIVEIAGLIDYFKDPNVKSFFESCKEMMSENATLFTCNIIPNKEEDLLHKLIGWMDMKYRTEEELMSTSFDKDNTRIITEPRGIHAIMSIEI